MATWNPKDLDDLEIKTDYRSVEGLGIVDRDNFALVTKIEEGKMFDENTYVDTESATRYIAEEILPEINPSSLKISEQGVTISLSEATLQFLSFHSYLPTACLYDNMHYYSYKEGKIYKHGVKDSHGRFNNISNKKFPFIIDFVSLAEDLSPKVWDFLQFSVTSYVKDSLDPDNKEYTEVNNLFFDKIVLYNDTQISGVLNVEVKDEDLGEDYLVNQIKNTSAEDIYASNSDGLWSINNFRNYRKDDDKLLPMWIEDPNTLVDAGHWFIDKVVNDDSVDFDKIWTKLEQLQGEYVRIRLIFDNFVSEPNKDAKIKIYFSIANKKTN